MSKRSLQRSINRKKNKEKSTLDKMLQMQAAAKQVAKEVESQATDSAFMYMLAIPLSVLMTSYWTKSGYDRAPKFINEVLDLYQAVQEGKVTHKELEVLLEKTAGIKIEGNNILQVKRSK